MKTIIAGSRTINSPSLVETALRRSGFKVAEVLSGGARGVDRLGEKWAQRNMIPVRRFPAYWKLFGKRAGYIRNEEMAEHAEALIAIWDGESPGTRHMIETAERKGLKVYVYEVR